MSKVIKSHLKLDNFNSSVISLLCGSLNKNLELLERELNVDINLYKHIFYIKGCESDVLGAKNILINLYQSLLVSKNLTQEISFEELQDLVLKTKSGSSNNFVCKDTNLSNKSNIKSGLIKFKNTSQEFFFNEIFKHSVSFGVGPAGTGKTFLAVAAAVHMLQTQTINRVVLTRPVVEAGERLGFLPGDLSQKIDPYLRPLYDALVFLLGFDRFDQYLKSKVIEISPLAYMRGRTLKDSCIILDEAQNTTCEQIKMFLTRIGEGSRMIITGDRSQSDIISSKQSGLSHACNILTDIDGIFFHYFSPKEIVRHPLVSKIVLAYEKDTIVKVKAE